MSETESLPEMDTANVNDLVLPKKDEEKRKQIRLGKRLAYILRYGAEVEDLRVEEGGWIDLSQICSHSLFEKVAPDIIVKEIDESTSARGQKRFEVREESERKLVRACYSRKFDRNPRHENSRVLRLMEIGLSYVCKNIKIFDLLDFQDEYLMRLMIKRFQSLRKFNNPVLRCVLGKTLTRLSLETAFVTDTTLNLVMKRCPKMKYLTLKDCYYIITDQKLEILFSKLKEIEYLDLSYCHHLTNKTLYNLQYMCPHLRALNIMGLPKITKEGLISLVNTCLLLKKLDIRDNPDFQTMVSTELRNYHDNAVILMEEKEELKVIYGKYRKDNY